MYVSVRERSTGPPVGISGLAKVSPRRHTYVRWVQASLNRLNNENLFVDGIIGPQTIAAIRRFQSQIGLTADGIVGRQTEAAIIAAGAGPPPSAPVTIHPRAKITTSIERALSDLEPHFQAAGLRVKVTSGYRSPNYQLGLIKRKAIHYGLDNKYPSIRTARVDDIESWRGAWDELLNVKGYIINPPIPTVSRIGKRAGRRIGASPHSSGKAFDLSSGNPGDLNRIAAVLRQYRQEGGPIRQILIERVNNAVHVGLS
jgi:hypothetical protein